MLNRSGVALSVSAVFLFAMVGAAVANQCSGKPDALGTSKILSVNPTDYPLVGRLQYMETLQLREREVVLTFDDGPMPPYTGKILDTLAAECVKATFFVLGANVAEAPELVRRVINEGHSVGTHTFGHADLAKLPFDEAKKEIETGIAAAVEAAGNSGAIAPFFRAPMLALNKKLESHLFSLGLMVWSIDADSSDWTLITEEKLIETAVGQLEKSGKGILLLHDIQPVTVRALPGLLAELKRPEISKSSMSSRERREHFRRRQSCAEGFGRLRALPACHHLVPRLYSSAHANSRSNAPVIEPRPQALNRSAAAFSTFCGVHVLTAPRSDTLRGNTTVKVSTMPIELVSRAEVGS